MGQKSVILLRINMSTDKCENVSFKVSLLSEDSLIKTEVRRFVVPQDCSTSLIYLKEKIRTIFNLGRSTCKVSWRDEDGDDVTIESDEELLIALQELNGPVYKLQVVKGSGLLPEVGQSQETSKTNNNKGEEHFGVTCDSCDGSINGFRYKCMVCPDYDLCGGCESKGIHPGHNMIRIASPESTWPRHFMNRLNRLSARAASRCHSEQDQSRGFSAARSRCKRKKEEKKDEKKNPENPESSGNSKSSRPCVIPLDIDGSWTWESANGIPMASGNISNLEDLKNLQEQFFPNSKPSNTNEAAKAAAEAATRRAENATAGAAAAAQAAAKMAAESAAASAQQQQPQGKKSPLDEWKLFADAAAQAAAAFTTQNQQEISNAGKIAQQLAANFANSGLAGSHFGQHFNQHFGTPLRSSLTSTTTTTSTSSDEKKTEEKPQEDVKEPEQPAVAASSAPVVQGEPEKPMTLSAIQETSDEISSQINKIKEASAEPVVQGEPDEEWTLLDKAASPVKENPSAPAKEDVVAEPSAPVQGGAPAQEGADALYPKLDEAKKPDYSHLSMKVQVAIQAMENMGFSNEDGWLTGLLEKYDGDIGKVLDLLQPVKPVRN